jgi:hypothetical protein
MVISCKVMSREIRYCASRSPHLIDIRLVDQGLHEFPGRLNKAVAKEVASVKGQYDYILLNYGVCGNGVVELSHPSLPIVLHQTHDCIPLLVGDKQKHRELAAGHPGTFWFTPGWIEGFPLPGAPDYRRRYREFYGRDVSETQHDQVQKLLMENYDRLVYIRWEELGKKLGDLGLEFTQACARSLSELMGRSFTCEEAQGTPSVLQRFVDGEWDSDDYLKVDPGREVRLDLSQGCLCAAAPRG